MLISMDDEGSPVSKGSSSLNEEEELAGEEKVSDGIHRGEFEGEVADYGAWRHTGKYVEGEGEYISPTAEGEEYPPFYGEGEYEYEPSVSEVSTVTSLVQAEETEEEKEARLEREKLIDQVRMKLMERIVIRRRNIYLHKKLAEHFKKRRMEHVLKEDPKGFELESKYLKRLFVFQEFKGNQESEMLKLTNDTEALKLENDNLEQELNETLNRFIQRQKEFSLGLVSTKTGKKLNERTVDRLLRRQIHKCIEKGKLKLKYVKLKNMIEEKENQLKTMENFGDGLHLMDYEQLKIDNQNYNDKIEEKEEELGKLRVKTHTAIQNLAQVREKSYAIEGDIELMEARFNEIENEFNNTRERVGEAKIMRDALRVEFAHLKMQSGLLTNDNLLRDFETSIDEKEKVRDILDEMKSLLKEKNKQQSELEDRLAKSYK